MIAFDGMDLCEIVETVNKLNKELDPDSPLRMITFVTNGEIGAIIHYNKGVIWNTTDKRDNKEIPFKDYLKSKIN